MKNTIILQSVCMLLLLTAGSCNNQKNKDDMETLTKDKVAYDNPEGARQSPAPIKSKDGTQIAYEKTGAGPAIIIVNGALSYRAVYDDKSLMSALSKDFTLYTYDRRGRGESTDTTPYSVDREIEDIEALITEAGGSAYLYGASSGAVLSLLAAARLGKSRISKLALYEPPFVSVSEKDKKKFEDQVKRIGELIKTGNRGDAAAFHFTAIGTPPEALEKLRKSREWPLMENVEHTLAYDYAILDDGAVPVDAAKQATMPVLVMNGEKSLPLMSEAANNLSRNLPNAQRKILNGQTHQASPEILAPVLKEFFKQTEK
jgi:pimeloyl-ACP methyl ester carboxylesterase